MPKLYQILILLSSLPTGDERLEMIDSQSLTATKERERKLQRDTETARSALFKASLVHRLRSPLPALQYANIVLNVQYKQAFSQNGPGLH